MTTSTDYLPTYSIAALRTAASSTNPTITGVISIHLDDVASISAEQFIDTLSERLIGSTLLDDTTYRVVGHEGSATLLIEVTGNPTAHLIAAAL